MALGVTEDGEGTLRLYTRDTMIVDARGCRRREEYLRQKAQNDYS